MIKAWISRTVLDVITKEAIRALPLETGGVLIGYRSHDAAEVVITFATGPGPNAAHSRSEFIPDDEYQDRKIDELYECSGRRHIYLGDWHTHPSGEKSLSFKDRRTLQRIAFHQGGSAGAPIMAVLAGNEHKWTLSIWRYERPVNVIDRLSMRCTRECRVVTY